MERRRNRIVKVARVMGQVVGVEGLLLAFLAALIGGVDLVAGRPVLGLGVALGLFLLVHATVLAIACYMAATTSKK